MRDTKQMDLHINHLQAIFIYISEKIVRLDSSDC